MMTSSLGSVWCSFLRLYPGQQPHRGCKQPGEPEERAVVAGTTNMGLLQRWTPERTGTRTKARGPDLKQPMRRCIRHQSAKRTGFCPRPLRQCLLGAANILQFRTGVSWTSRTRQAAVSAPERIQRVARGCADARPSSGETCCRPTQQRRFHLG
jgi:hypothetical protein